jgi:hypothetical protein
MLHLSTKGGVNIKDSKKNRNLFNKEFEIRPASLFIHMITKVVEYMEKIVNVPIKDIENNMGQYVENDCTTTALWLYSKFKIVFGSSKTVKCDWGSLNWINFWV